MVELNAEVVQVTPDIAAKLRSECHFERQRPISKGNVDRLVLEMKEGWFIPGTPIYICVLPDGTQKIANGNHTLEAVKEAGVSVPLTLIYASVPDLDAVARVYANMDLQKVRTWQNSLQAIKGESTSFDSKVVSAVGVILNDFSPVSTSNRANAISRTARFRLFEEYQDAKEIIRGAISGGDKQNARAILRAGALAVALITVRHQPSFATDFWRSLVMDDGLKVGDPRKALLKYLIANTGENGSKARTETVKATASAWNSFWAKREVSYLKPALMTEIKIFGTPWHNGKPGARPVNPTRLVRSVRVLSDEARRLY